MHAGSMKGAGKKAWDVRPDDTVQVVDPHSKETKVSNSISSWLQVFRSYFLLAMKLES